DTYRKTVKVRKDASDGQTEELEEPQADKNRKKTGVSSRFRETNGETGRQTPQCGAEGRGSQTQGGTQSEGAQTRQAAPESGSGSPHAGRRYGPDSAVVFEHGAPRIGGTQRARRDVRHAAKARLEHESSRHRRRRRRRLRKCVLQRRRSTG